MQRDTSVRGSVYYFNFKENNCSLYGMYCVLHLLLVYRICVFIFLHNRVDFLEIFSQSTDMVGSSICANVCIILGLVKCVESNLAEVNRLSSEAKGVISELLLVRRRMVHVSHSISHS